MTESVPPRVASELFPWGRRTYVMAIVNVTPDSFAATGPGEDTGAAVRYARRQIAEGADIVDIGGESTRPGATPVDAVTELRRVIPVIEELAAAEHIPLSVDTMKAEVANAALAAGAVMVNDIHGFRGDPAMARVVARRGAHAVLMANLRGRRATDVIEAVTEQLRESLTLARHAGITEERLILDPGFGFGPAPAQNLEMIRRLAELRTLGRPLLIGPSRKSTIGVVLDLPVEERLEGTAAAVAIAIAHGADIVRVHDTRAIVRVARMTDAIVHGWSGGTERVAGVGSAVEPNHAALGSRTPAPSPEFVGP